MVHPVVSSGVDDGGLVFDGGPKLDAGLKTMRKRGSARCE